MQRWKIIVYKSKTMAAKGDRERGISVLIPHLERRIVGLSTFHKHLNGEKSKIWKSPCSENEDIKWYYQTICEHKVI